MNGLRQARITLMAQGRLVRKIWSKLSVRAKKIVGSLLAAMGLVGGCVMILDLIERFENRYDETVPLVYYGTNDFRKFLDRHIGEVVKLKSGLVMDVMPGFAENMLLNHICGTQPEIEEKLPANVFVTGFPEFKDGYVEPEDYVYNEREDSYVFPVSATDHVRCYDTLRVEFKDPGQIRFNHGGTGLVSLPLNGGFMIERRAFSGPRSEYTLREQ